MREKKFTESEWHVVDDNFIYALNDDNTNRFCFSIQGGFEKDRDGERVRTSSAEITANANLVKTAPELLEECETSLKALKELDILPAHVKYLEKVIAKAYGEHHE